MTRPFVTARREALKQRIAGLIETTPGCTGNQIQAGIGGNLQIMRQAISDLITTGHVTRHRDPDDGRIWRYTLTRDYKPPVALPAPPRARTCDQCGNPLPRHKKRFCSEICRARKQKTERPPVENGDYAAWLARSITKMGKRASNDLNALGWLAGAVDHARDALALAVAGCRAEGYSDAEIGQALGITRQAVGQRFGRKQGVYTGQPGTEATA